MKMFKDRKGAYNLEQLLSVGMVFVATAIGLAFGAKVLSEIAVDLEAGAGVDAGNNSAVDIIRNGTESLNVLGKWLPTIALIAVAALIVSLVVGAFYVMGRK